MSPLHHLPIPFNQLGTLHRYPLLRLRRTHQTGKGKVNSQYALVIVGTGNGLVGLGEGKADEPMQAMDNAYAQAIRNMDYVDRFEGRTLWTEMETKFGSTRIYMRPRPVGFGLMCAPGIHQIFKAAGVKDASVKIWGSRNKVNVAKAAIRMLHAGHQPLGFGDGIGGEGRRMEKGVGMRGKAIVERERGRRILDARTW
ncbi:ribosomal protein S5 domain 2-like protein [Hysterangium stoloniferum]|nr:ribosomal protein S5 domain 2-like protein [Hysterangium stoloniferum]